MRWLLLFAGLCACTPAPDPRHARLLNHLRDGRPAARISAIQELAPHANKEDTAAIVRAAQDGSVDVRKAVATALSKVDADNTVDLTAAFLRDPSDDVRAAAAKTLAARGGPRAGSYIAHAYASGGPRMRAAIASTGEAALTDAVAMEVKTLQSDRQRRAKDPHEQIKEEAIVDLGQSSTPEAIAELVTRLGDANVGTAAAGCVGLAQANALEQLPFIQQALKAGRPELTQACAFAVATLDPAHASDQLAPLLKSADALTASSLLDRLSELKLSDAALDAVCRTAVEQPDGAIALRAATIVGAHCTLAAPYPATWTQTDQFLVGAALVRKSPALLKDARDLLAGKDAELASSAARYLGACGSEDDATLLMSQTSAELHDMDFARAQVVQNVDQKRFAQASERMKHDDEIRAAIGDDKFAQYQKLQPPLRDKLLARLKRSPGPEVSDEFETRPGEIDLISACIAGARDLGADVSGLAAVIFDEKELRLRMLGLRLANALPTGEALRALARTDSDRLIARAQNIYDLQAGDLTAIERLPPLMTNAATEQREEIAELLGPLATKSTLAATLLISITQGADSAVPVAAAGLGAVRTPEATHALLALLQDPKGNGAVVAIQTLGDRPGPDVDAALADAAVHPVAPVREAALRALVTRHACASVGALRVLRNDYSGAVRGAATALATACPAPAAPATSHP